MKTVEEIIEKIEDESSWVLPADLIEEIIIPAMEEYGKQCKSEAIDETVKACAEAAKNRYLEHGMTNLANRAMIDCLSVSEQLKSKL